MVGVMYCQLSGDEQPHKWNSRGGHPDRRDGE